jgi:hypothetical protein
MNADPQVQDVYAEHGAAMGEAQLLEQYLGYLILAAQEPTGFESFQKEMALVSKQSLRELIRNLEKACPVPSSFRNRLEAARVKRNWLAHRYFSERAESFQTTAGRLEMIRELDQIGEEFYELWGNLDAIIVGWLGRQNPTIAVLIEDFSKTTCF